MTCTTTLRTLLLQKVPVNIAFVSLIVLCFVLFQMPFSSAYIGSWCPCTHAFGRQGLSVENSHILHLYVHLLCALTPAEV